MDNKLKKLDAGTDHFECGGKKFYISDKLSFTKFEKLSEWALEFGYSATFKDIFIKLKQIWESIEKGQIGTCAVTVHNLMSGIVNLEQKYNVAFRICALFILEENESEVEYSESKINEKIECWSKELDATFFLNFAASLIPYWITAYKNVSLNISKEQNQKEQSNISVK